MPEILDISPGRLALIGVFVAVMMGITLYEGLKLQRDILLGTVRTVLQLLLVGYVIEFVFRLNRWYVVLGVLMVMVAAATQTAVGRLRRRSRWLYLDAGIALAVASGFTLLVVTEAIVGVSPWYDPRYLIPLAGMIVSNAMNGATLAADRFVSELRLRMPEVETLLCLGYDARQASRTARQQALSVSMIPTINAMMVVGIVSLPGMMTGQILAGNSPLIAVKYQIVVMLMIACTVAVASWLLLRLLLYRCFTRAHQVRYEILDDQAR